MRAPTKGFTSNACARPAETCGSLFRAFLSAQLAKASDWNLGVSQHLRSSPPRLARGQIDSAAGADVVRQPIGVPFPLSTASFIERVEPVVLTLPEIENVSTVLPGER